MEENLKIPNHVAIILDGNGRWAKAKGMPRNYGHMQGAKTVEVICEEAYRMGIQYLTVYAFSTENWNRPQAEVDALMHLIGIAIQRETPDLIKNNVRLRMIGDFDRMPEDPRRRLQQCFDDTAHCNGLVLNLALSYSGRWDITRAAQLIAADVAAGRISPDDIDEHVLASRLSTSTLPCQDPDLLIRTGGEMRVSNFLLWEIAYSEIVVTDKFWPEFNKEDFIEAVRLYQSRERRFGKTSEQVGKNRP